MLCGTFGCTLPDSHAGLHQVPAPARARERRPTAKARDDSYDSDEEQLAAVVRVTASGTRRMKASAPPARIIAAGGVCKRHKCEHGRWRSGCMKECGGSDTSKCEHGRRRDQCKDCGGAGICEHGRRRSQCKECGGASICKHGRRYNECKECGGVSICEHGRVRSSCKECGGASMCKHRRQRHICHQCGGASICKHGRRYNQCKECGGVSICEHGRQHSKCKECKACAVRAMDEGGLFDFLDVLSDFDVEIDV